MNAESELDANTSALAEALRPRSPAIRLDADGVLKVARTRVPIDTVIGAFWDGATVEGIVIAYDVLHPADVHEVLAFYLRNRPTIDDYLERRRQQSAAVRRENEARWPNDGIRERLLARRRASTAPQDAS